MVNILNLFKKDKGDDELESYFECEDDVEAALTWLDNHPNATLEEYEAWLNGRDDAISKIKLSKSENKDRSYI